MPIVSSSYSVDAHAQADGTFYVRERHQDDDGNLYEFEWRGDPNLAPQVIERRREELDRQLAQRRAAEDVVVGTSFSLTTTDFMRRFTLQEEASIRIAARTDPVIEVLLARLASARTVRLSHPDITSGLAYLVQRGLLSAERAAEIGAP